MFRELHMVIMPGTSTYCRSSLSEVLMPHVLSLLIQIMGVSSWLLVVLQSRPVSAGTCWSNMSPEGRCRDVIRTGVSVEACCRDASVNHGWSVHENPSDAQIFYWTHLTGGAPSCQACHTSCENVICERGKRCEMKQGRPKCVCAPDCSSIRYPDHTHGNRHVCGYDGQSFRNQCSLLKYNCRQHKQVMLDYYGRCQKSCHTVHCQEGTYCNTDQNGLPHCITCPDHCPTPPNSAVDQRVCGSDRQTYPSFCHLHRHTCRNSLSIIVAYHGPCTESATCDTVSCPQHKQCQLEPETDQPHCVDCSMACSTSVFGRVRVCGTDDQTYSSWCQLFTSSCRQRSVIRTRHTGACGSIPHGHLDDTIIS